MSTRWLIAIFSAAAMAFSAGAMGQGTGMGPAGFYIGADVGQTDVGSDDDIGFKLFGGYQFHRNIAAELGYGLLYDKGGVDLTSLEALAVGIFPIANQISFLAKLGIARLEADGPGGSGDETELTYGIGLQYDVTPNIGVRLHWQRYNTDPDDIDFIGLGALFRF